MSIQRMNLRLVSTAALTLATLGVGSVAAVDDAHEALMRVRVPFVENRGQLDRRVAYVAQANFGTAFVTREGRLTYALPAPGTRLWVLTETFVSGTPRPAATIASKTRVSRFHGLDPANWQTNLLTFEEVELGEVWPGVSVGLRAYGGEVEKIYTLDPGTSPDRIQMRMGGAKSLRVDSDRTLIAVTDNGEVSFSAPAAYQEKDRVRSPVEVGYVLRGKCYGFRLGPHDPSLPVVIDPLLQSTYLGGTVHEDVTVVVVHPSTGEVLVGGTTSSTDFPGTAGGAQTASGGLSEGFVARLDSSLTTLLQATYLGGLGDDHARSIAVHPTTGEVLVAGQTSSTGFPGTAGGAQAGFGGFRDGFVARFDSTLTTLLQATYVGGLIEDDARSIAVHPSTGDVVVAGATVSPDLPGTAGGAQPGNAGGGADGFVARFTPTLTALLQATYLGGSGADLINSMSIHPTTGEVFVAGETTSTDLPARTGGAQPSIGGAFDGFAARLGPALTNLLQATYLGGSEEDLIGAIATAPATGEIFVAGETLSSDLPEAEGGAQPSIGGDRDGFLARFGSTLTTLPQLTYLGGSQPDFRFAVAIHPMTGAVLASGWTYSTDFPATSGGVQAGFGGGSTDGIVALLSPSLTTLLQSTFLGGSGFLYDGVSAIAIGPSTGEVFVAGQTWSRDFPATGGGAQPAPPIDPDGFAINGFVARLTPDLQALLSPMGLAVDLLPNPGDGNHIFEPGETVAVAPSWRNLSDTTYAPNGQASSFEGPPGPTHTIGNGSVTYVAIVPAGDGIPEGPYTLSISLPGTRPATHWDAVFTESLDVPTVLSKKWTLHVGDSFPDVVRSHIFYAFVENILHHGITGGCAGGNYCPSNSVTRAQMAVFLLKSKFGAAHIPPPCTGAVFGDVPCSGGLFDPWIEELAALQITGGCGGGLYCPGNTVTRQQMAVFLLKALEGSSYDPPDCTGIFDDVPCTPGTGFPDWIEEFSTRSITGGCSISPPNYCPTNPNTRGQMAVFLVKAFGLAIYGP